MLEVPAAAVMIDDLLELVDFVSVGSNDLVQYLTAADRDNPKVSHLCQALSPAVLRVLRNVIAACCKVNKPVSVCGEMAGSPRAFPLLLGMGLRSFSMSSSFIPAIRDFTAQVLESESPVDSSTGLSSQDLEGDPPADGRLRTERSPRTRPLLDRLALRGTHVGLRPRNGVAEYCLTKTVVHRCS